MTSNIILSAKAFSETSSRLVTREAFHNQTTITTALPYQCNSFIINKINNMSSNQTSMRITRSRFRASSSTHSVATEPSDASAAPKTPAPAPKTDKPQRKAASKSTKSTKVVKGKGNGRGTKPSSTAASTSSTSSTSAAEVPDLDDNNDHSSLIFTAEDLKLSEDEQKARLVDIFTHLGIKDINKPIPSSKEESLRARLQLGNAQVNILLKLFAPGCTKKTSTDTLILADYLRRAIFPADVSVTIEHFYIICCCKSRLTLINCLQNLEGVLACRQNGSELCDISLRSTCYHVTRIRPQSGNGVTQKTLKDAIQKQVDSVRNGGNHYHTDSNDDQLKEKLQRLGVKSKLPTKRPALLRKLWEKERDVSSTTVVGSGNDRNAPVVSVYSAVCFCLLLLAVSIYKHSTSFNLFTFLRN